MLITINFRDRSLPTLDGLEVKQICVSRSNFSINVAADNLGFDQWFARRLKRKLQWWKMYQKVSFCKNFKRTEMLDKGFFSEKMGHVVSVMYTILIAGSVAVLGTGCCVQYRVLCLCSAAWL